MQVEHYPLALPSLEILEVILTHKGTPGRTRTFDLLLKNRPDSATRLILIDRERVSAGLLSPLRRILNTILNTNFRCAI